MSLPLSRRIRATYITLMFGNTLAASLIWGINTLFLLDAGLSNLEAFAANAFFTLGMVLFEVPTGVVADTWGRRASYLLGTLTLAATTAGYYGLWTVDAPFWAWAVVSMLLGLGFTFFSGAVEAWLVDALEGTGFRGSLESVFGHAQIAAGIAMLSGSVVGGFIAQATNLGVPFVIRAIILLVMFIVAALLMRDIGFTPDKTAGVARSMRTIFASSIKYGLGNPSVKWMMIAAPFTASVGFYVFYALQPYLLQIYGDQTAYGIAGLAAALVATAQIIGGMLAGRIRQLFTRRTSAVMAATIASSVILVGLWLTNSFVVALVLTALWGLIFAAVMPIRQAYLNGMIPSRQRATVLSFDSLMGNTGGVIVQPALGRTADVTSYGSSFAIGSLIQLAALPFIWRSKRAKHASDAQLQATSS